MPESFSSALIAAKNSRLNPEPLVWLAELDASGLGGGPASATIDHIVREWIGANEIRLAFHDTDITYDGKKYYAFAGRVDSAKHKAGGLLRQTISVQAVDRRMIYMLENGGIIDKPVTLKQVSLDSLSSTTHHRTFRYLCTKAGISEDGASFELGSPLLTNRLLPKYRFLRYRCSFAFKDTRTCKYTGGLTTCDKSYDQASGCAGRSNQENYGGFPDLLTGSADPWL